MNCPDCDGFVCCVKHAKYIHNNFHDPKGVKNESNK